MLLFFKMVISFYGAQESLELTLKNKILILLLKFNLRKGLIDSVMLVVAKGIHCVLISTVVFMVVEIIDRAN